MLRYLYIFFTTNSLFAKTIEEAPRFPRIEQPLTLKLAVALIGLMLIALDLWWFLGGKNNK